MTTTTRRDRSTAARPSVEPLEGRTLMAAAPLATAFDTSFGGGDGAWHHDVGKSSADAIAVTPEGNTFVAQTVWNNGARDVSIRQLNPDGTEFAKFVMAGAQNTFPLAGHQDVVDLVVQKDGRPILLATDYSQARPRMMIARFMWNGMIDNTFGGKGVMYLTPPPSVVWQQASVYGGSLALGNDGRIFASGAAQWTDGGDWLNGVATFAFDSGGYAPAWGEFYHNEYEGRLGFTMDEFGLTMHHLSKAMDSVVTPDGRLMVGGTYVGDMFTLKYKSWGDPDTTFGERLKDGTGTGYARLSLLATEELTSVTLQPDGRFVIGGQQQLSDGRVLGVLARVKADGTGWDASFGGAAWGGVRKFRPGAYNGLRFEDVARQADGKFVALARADGKTVVARFTADGLDDNTLTGSANHAGVFLGQYQVATDLAVTPGGRYLVAGRGGSADNNKFATVARLDGAPVAPSAPKYLTLSSKTTTSLSLRWTDTSSFNTGFELTYSKAPITTFNPGTVVTVSGGNTTTATLTNLSPDTTYYVRARAVNRTPSGLVAKSAWSGEWSTKTAATIAAPAPVVPTKLAGTVIGTAGSYGSFGNTRDNAFDGNVNTYFDGPAATGNWVGLDLGAARSVKQVKYAPRAGHEARMVGGKFQASNTADFSAGVVDLLTVTAPPPAGALTTAAVNVAGTFRYVRYVAPANSFGNVAEAEFWG